MEVKCTQCGGAVTIKEHQGLAKCPYCGSSLYLDINEGIVHLIARPKLIQKELPIVLQTFLEKKERKGLPRIIRINLIFWPFWQTFDMNGKVGLFPASSSPITDLENAHIPVLETEPFNEEIVENSHVEAPIESVYDFLIKRGLKAQKVKLLHIPFYQVIYNYGGAVEYEVWIDAVTGQLFADELPPTFSNEKDKLYLKMAGLAAGVYILIALLIPNGDIAAILMLVASIPLHFYIRKKTRELNS